MSKKIKAGIVLTMMLCLATVFASGSDSGKTKVKGLITGRTGETLVLSSNGNQITVVLTDDTKVQRPKGMGLRKQQMSMSALIPGLKISVDGTTDAQSRVVAKTITFNEDDLQTAEMIQAGLEPTKQNVAANTQNIDTNKQNIDANKQAIGENKQAIAQNQADTETNKQDIAATSKRFNELTDYETKGDVDVLFATGSTALSAKSKSDLQALAKQAVAMTGYIIEVKGFADSTGNAKMNQKLSMDRAQAVIAYLVQDCSVPVRHVIAPGAMGTADPAATNETAKGRAENRRVEVKVIVNKGLAGN